MGAIRHLVRDTPHALSERDFTQLGVLTDGYSQSDLRGLCAEAAMGPVRDMKGDRGFFIVVIPLTHKRIQF